MRRAEQNCCLLSDGVQIESPLHSVDFLNDLQTILRSRFTPATVDQCLDSAGIFGAAQRFQLFFLLWTERERSFSQ